MHYHTAKPSELTERPREASWSIADCADIVSAALKKPVVLELNGSLPNTAVARVKRGGQYLGCLVFTRFNADKNLIIQAKWPVTEESRGRRR